MEHLCWHKRRLVSLGPKIEGLSDGHPSKPRCLFQLSQVFGLVGNDVEQKRLLSHTLEIWRERGDDRQVARTLLRLSEVNDHYYEEGEQQAKEALQVYEQLGDTAGQAECLRSLAALLCHDEQPDAAEEAAFRAIGLLPEKGSEYLLSYCQRSLGMIYQSKGEIEKAIHRFETALGIASSFGWHNEVSGDHYYLALLFSNQGRFDEANAHVEHAKSRAVNSLYDLASSMYLQAILWSQQFKFEQAKSEALRAIEVFEKLGAEQDLGRCREVLKTFDSVQEQVARLSLVVVSSWKSTTSSAR